jgi:hypothetical protein
MMMMAAAVGYVYGRKLWLIYVIYLSVLAAGLAAFVIGAKIVTGVIALVALAAIFFARSHRGGLEASSQPSPT